ncbi:unnamed protein product [Protopolystoma xenopodis]|uniref:LIM zinc-binding domain-containing protein n=1 Tax=Protopolystoma xenopodis TaxID=117903 RepID=A0A448WGM4_9PLAT|nr:unnamed protein product [Protopolystoma xenopodis]
MPSRPGFHTARLSSGMLLHASIPFPASGLPTAWIPPCSLDASGISGQAVFESAVATGSELNSLISTATASTAVVTRSTEPGPLLLLPPCSGCCHRLEPAPYLLHVAPDQFWHPTCLVCVACATPLEAEGACWLRQGRPYCQRDYARSVDTAKCCLYKRSVHM